MLPNVIRSIISSKFRFGLFIITLFFPLLMLRFLMLLTFMYNRIRLYITPIITDRLGNLCGSFNLRLFWFRHYLEDTKSSSYCSYIRHFLLLLSLTYIYIIYYFLIEVKFLPTNFYHINNIIFMTSCVKNFKVITSILEFLLNSN